MSTPAIPIPRTETLQRRPKARVDRSGTLVEIWLRAHTLLVYLFLFVPIIVVQVSLLAAYAMVRRDWHPASCSKPNWIVAAARSRLFWSSRGR